jgi:hypothetical protein
MYKVHNGSEPPFWVDAQEKNRLKTEEDALFADLTSKDFGCKRV